MRSALKPLAAALLVALGASSALAQAPAAAADPESPEAKKARLAWFHQAKFGLFIHWGLYAIPAGEWKGKRVPGIGEWIMFRAQDPRGRVRAARAAAGTR